MLISMPTGTSTIFGVFQLIRVSPKQCWHEGRASIETRLTSNIAQAWTAGVEGIPTRLTPQTSLLDKAISLLDKASARKRPIDACARVGRGSRILFACRSACRRRDFGGDVGEPAEAPTIRHRLSFAPQQSLSAVLLSALAPSDRCAAVGSPCICRCVSCEDAATSPVARFMVPVGGC